MIKWNEPIIATFKERKKRFFSYFSHSHNNDIENLTAHCYNTGKMTGLLELNAPSVLSKKDSGALNYTWEAVFVEGTWIGTNTSIPNKLVKDYLPVLFPNQQFKSEVKLPGNIRVDFANENTIIEVKNVHWNIDGTAFFPDCVTSRGARQLEAIRQYNQDKEIYIIYLTQRQDVNAISVAKDIDPDYYNALNNIKCHKICLNCKVSPVGIEIHEQIPFKTTLS